jgi:hypothetical protein
MLGPRPQSAVSDGFALLVRKRRVHCCALLAALLSASAAVVGNAQARETPSVGRAAPTIRFTAVSTSEEQGAASAVCALTIHREPVCWDDNANTYIAPKGAYTQVSVGGALDDYAADNFVCGLRTDQTVRCWSIVPPVGKNVEGKRLKASPYGPQPSGKFLYVAAGPAAACGIRPSGRIFCWLDEQDLMGGNPDPLPRYRFTQLSLGGDGMDSWAQYFGCGIRENGELACWGRDLGGEPRLAVASPPKGGFIQVDADSGGACALREDGTATCWGGPSGPTLLGPRYRYTQISGGTALRRNREWQGPNGVILPGHLFRQITIGGGGGCGLQLDGTLYPNSAMCTLPPSASQ